MMRKYDQDNGYDYLSLGTGVAGKTLATSADNPVSRLSRGPTV